MHRTSRSALMIALSLVLTAASTLAHAQTKEPGGNGRILAPSTEGAAPATSLSVADRFWKRLAEWSVRPKSSPSWSAAYARPVAPLSAGKRSSR